MSYAGFGIQSMNSFRKPRQAFKPIFNQLFEGEHPTESKGGSIFKTWTEMRRHLDKRERAANDLSRTIFQVFVMVALIAVTVASIAA